MERGRTPPDLHITEFQLLRRGFQASTELSTASGALFAALVPNFIQVIVAALLNTEALFTPTPELRKIGRIEKVGGGSPTPEDRRLTASWGRKQAETVMPGRGKTEAVKGEFDAALGEAAVRVYLNDNLYWENVPESVWTYSLGGYQVVKKWLSYRELDVLGRALSIEEIRYASSMFQRIASLLLISKELDASYAIVASAEAQAPSSVEA